MKIRIAIKILNKVLSDEPVRTSTYHRMLHRATIPMLERLEDKLLSDIGFSRHYEENRGVK